MPVSFLSTTQRERYGRYPESLSADELARYREFADSGIQFRLGRWLCALCWTGTDRPSALFDYANGWLVGHKVLLPGVTVLERFVAEVRSRMESRLWRLLVRGVTQAQRQRLDDLLKPAEGGRQSWLDRLRKGPVRVSAPSLVLACSASRPCAAWESSCQAPYRQAVSRRWPASPAPSRFPPWPGCRRHVASLRWWPSHTAWRPARRTMPLMCSTCCCASCSPRPALNEVRGLVRPPDDAFYTELEARKATVSRFLPALPRVIQFDANPAAEPLVQALQWLHQKPDHDPPSPRPRWPH